MRVYTVEGGGIPGFHGLLDTSTKDLLNLDGYHDGMATQLGNVLRRDGLIDVRRIVTVGYKYIGELRNAGKGSLDRLQEALAGSGLDSIMADEPDTEIIANTCRGIDEVHIGALGLHGVSVMGEELYNFWRAGQSPRIDDVGSLTQLEQGALENELRVDASLLDQKIDAARLAGNIMDLADDLGEQFENHRKLIPQPTTV